MYYWNENTKMDLKEVRFEGEHGNEPSCFTKNAAFLVHLTDYYFPKDTAPWY
jgi:hypothetical protein